MTYAEIDNRFSYYIAARNARRITQLEFDGFIEVLKAEKEKLDHPVQYEQPKPKYEHWGDDPTIGERVGLD